MSIVTLVVFYVIPTSKVQTRGGGFTDLQKAPQLNGPILEQYGQWLWRLGHGSLGRSFFSRRTVTSIVGAAAPVTIWLTLGGAVVWMLIALPLGILSALRPRWLLDRGATTSCSSVSPCTRSGSA
jgi:peptide/nickel transport system permease protein